MTSLGKTGLLCPDDEFHEIDEPGRLNFIDGWRMAREVKSRDDGGGFCRVFWPRRRGCRGTGGDDCGRPAWGETSDGAGAADVQGPEPGARAAKGAGPLWQAGSDLCAESSGAGERPQQYDVFLCSSTDY